MNESNLIANLMHHREQQHQQLHASGNISPMELQASIRDEVCICDVIVLFERYSINYRSLTYI